MVNSKASDNEDPKLGSVQAPQEGDTDKQLDTPVADNAPDGDTVPANQPVPDQDDQEADNPEASHKPGEAQGRKTEEIKAAEQPLDETAEDDLLINQGVANPVAEATGSESKDPYAEGKHIANPEPNNGAGNVDEDAEADEAKDAQDQQADDLQDQKAVDANAEPASK